MYWPDVTDLQAFYSSRLGKAVRRRLRECIITLWPELLDKEIIAAVPYKVLGIGFPAPYMQHFLDNKNVEPFVLMPAAQGALQWPFGGKNRSLLGKEDALPFEDDTIDRIIVAHGLEYTKHPLDMMGELFRVLSPQGKLLIIVPNRRSIWSRVETTPLGHGYPYSVTQIESLLKQSMFTPTKFSSALFFPPTQRRFILRLAQIACRLWQRVKHIILLPRVFCLWGGVIVIEAEKHIYTAYLEGSPVRRSGFIYRPVPSVSTIGSTKMSKQ